MERCFNTSTELYKAMIDTVGEAMSETSPQFEEILQQAIDETVYSRPSESDYVRTRAMRNAVDSQLDKPDVFKQSLDINIQEGKMTYNYPSQSGSQDNRENIVKWLNDGHRGFYNGNPVFYAPAKFFELATGIIEQIGTKIITNRLHNKGVETK